MLSMNYPRAEDIWKKTYWLVIILATLLPLPVSWEFCTGGVAYFKYFATYDRFETVVPNIVSLQECENSVEKICKYLQAV